MTSAKLYLYYMDQRLIELAIKYSLFFELFEEEDEEQEQEDGRPIDEAEGTFY